MTTSSYDSAIPTALVAVATLCQGVGTAFIGFFVAPADAPFVVLLANIFCMLLPCLYLAGTRRRGSVVWTTKLIALLAAINLSTALTFVLYYIAVSLIPPSASTVLEAGMGPSILLVAGLFRLTRMTTLAQTFVTSALTLTVVATTIYLLVFDTSETPFERSLGIIFSILAGIGSVTSILISRRLADANLTAMTINAYRFPLAICASAALCFLPHSASTQPWLKPENYLLAFIAIALPILGLQYGIGRVAPARTALLLSTLPAIVFVVETLLTGIVDIPLLALSALIVVISIGGVLLQIRVDQAGENLVSLKTRPSG